MTLGPLDKVLRTAVAQGRGGEIGGKESVHTTGPCTDPPG